MTATKAQSGEGGFALAEALVSLAIIATMLGVTFQAVGTMSHARDALLGERRAALLAQSLMARVGTDIALAPGSTSGVADGLNWRVDMARSGDASAVAAQGTRLMRVAVTVQAEGRQKVGFTLESLRVAP